MTLNATLMVQMLNFCIIWLIIKYLFVHPIVRIRAGIRQVLAAAEHERSALNTALLQINDERYKLWHTWYLRMNTLIKQHPSPIPHVPLMISKMVAPEIPTSEIEATIERLTDTIVTQIERPS